MEAYHALVCEHTKNDAKPISDSLDQWQNLALILETPEIGVTSISVYTNTNAWDASIFYIIGTKCRPAAKSGEYIPKIALKTSTYICVLQHNICLIWPVWILVHHFFLAGLFTFLFLIHLFAILLQPHANSCVQMSNISLKQATTIVVHTCK